MTAGFRNSSGVDFDSLFDPYVQGTKPGATGYRTSDGVDLNQRFAPLVYGTAAAATGFRLSSGADVNTLWAAKGTANYALPINGTSYSSNVSIPSASSGSASLQFVLGSSGTTWFVISGGTGGTLTPSAGTKASGSVPSGASTVQYTQTIISGSGGTVANGAATATAVSSNPGITITQSGTGTGPGNSVNRSVVIVFRNAGGTAISTTTIQFSVSYEGSA